MNKKIICLWGGPGTGKSTTCAGLFNLLKKNNFDAEMNREYVKDWVWEGRKIHEGDQVYITAKQAKKEATYIRSNVDFIITDSPLALCSFYGSKFDKYEQEFEASRQILKQHHSLCKDYGYKIEHFLLTRQKSYNPKGRLQDEQTAKAFDTEIEIFLNNYPIKYTKLIASKDVEQDIFNLIVQKQNTYICANYPSLKKEDHE